MLSLFLRPLDMVHADVTQAVFTYVNMVITLATVIGTLWLATCVHRKELQRMAHTDALTGLMNRRAFEEVLEQELARSELSGKGVAVMMIDLDHFKRINDAGGHAAGDHALLRVAAGLRAATRRTDLVARWGGEEFTILLHDVADEDAPAIAESLRATIAKLPAVEGEMPMTASIGLAISHPGEPLTDFLHRCDEALYRSKREGRNQVTIHSLHEREIRSAAGRG
jgi:diguanylate cyclase (GGDEF)-like protein